MSPNLKIVCASGHLLKKTGPRWDLAVGAIPRHYKRQKWTFQQKYNHFEKKFSKIDKKFVSQSILEVGPFTFHRVSKKY